MLVKLEIRPLIQKSSHHSKALTKGKMVDREYIFKPRCICTAKTYGSRPVCLYVDLLLRFG